jgi:WhiB family redox-sensing transcriptional regulator
MNLEQWEQWTSKANCAGLGNEIFYDEAMIKEKYYKNICNPCAVKQTCLTYALENKETFGVWGNTTPQERAALLQRKGKRA